MQEAEFDILMQQSRQPEALDRTVAYLTEHLRPIVKPGEYTLICFSRSQPHSFGTLLKRAVEACGGLCVFWEEDLRWKELLRLAFVYKASTVIASPLILLSLSKIAAYRGIPLYVYNAVMTGYPCTQWVMEGIRKGFDCGIWGIFVPDNESIVAGFSCNCGYGIHVRDDLYCVDLVDKQGNSVEPGDSGMIVLASRQDPQLRFSLKSKASFLQQPCGCGSAESKLVQIDLLDEQKQQRFSITQQLLQWNSVLECRIDTTDCGMELEVVCFAGEKIPKLPSCARLVVRQWNPETDVPMYILSGRDIP